MNISKTDIHDVVIIEPSVFGDERGYFLESFESNKYQNALGREYSFVQDNESMSSKGVLRGLHYQLPAFAQTKLVRCVLGVVLDVAVDIRRGSPTFGEHVAVELSGENKKQLLVPRGFAHGFVVLSQKAIFSYKVDNFYSPESERSIAYDDPDLAIDWKLLRHELQLSGKDQEASSLKEADLFDFSQDLYA